MEVFNIITSNFWLLIMLISFLFHRKTRLTTPFLCIIIYTLGPKFANVFIVLFCLILSFIITDNYSDVKNLRLYYERKAETKYNEWKEEYVRDVNDKLNKAIKNSASVEVINGLKVAKNDLERQLKEEKEKNKEGV